MDDTELELIKEALTGGETAFEEIVRCFSRRLFAVAYAVLQNAEEAEDVVQETFLKAYRYRWRLRDPGKFPAWLYTVARHRACDLLRRRRNVTLPENLADLPDDAQGRPGDQLEDAEQYTGLLMQLAKLPLRQRTALTLRYLEGMDARGIESIMGISNGALRGILGRALATLRQSLSHTAFNEGRS